MLDIPVVLLTPKLTTVAAVLHKEHGKEIDMVALCVLSLILETTKDDTFGQV